MTAIVLRGDAAHLPLPDGSVDLICTSPPYFGLRSYTDAGETYDGQIGSEATPAEWVAALVECTREWMRVLKPSGSLFVNLGDSFSSGQRYDNEFTIEDAAWLAGVIDSDGSISIHKQGTSYTAWVRVGQMRPEVVKRIESVTGIGTVCEDKRGCWHWQAAAQQASAVLTRIWPWLHIKRRQAYAAVELQERKAAVGGKGRWNALTEGELRYRERIRQAVLAWNAGEADDYEPPLLPLPDLPPRARWIPTKSLMGLPWRYALAAQDELGLILRRDIIFSKPNGLPESVTDRCRSSHEYLFHLVKQPRYYSAVDEIREAYAPGTAERYRSGYKANSRGSAGASSSGVLLNMAGGDGGPDAVNPLGKLPGSVWEIPSQPLTVPPHLGIDHFAAYPMELPRRCILGWSPSGICLKCGEGRRPVGDTERTFDGEPAGPGKGGVFGDMKRLSRNKGVGNWRFGSRTTITGYACACTPYTYHPERRGKDFHAGTDRAGQGMNDRNGGERFRRYVEEQANPRGPVREYHLEDWTPPPTRPAVVLDPFGGTGTTSLVADVLGRTGITVDRSADYCRLARWRTTDPAERARALGVPKPPPVPEGQASLFDLEAS